MNNQVVDVLIIGGGINGCAIARDAAGRGLSVSLCEKNDLASGTSSASTKLIHGGLRYLEQYEFKLVRKALNEREVMLNMAPHIIRPQRFVLPFHPSMRPAWLIRTGLFIYDRLAYRNHLLPVTRSVKLGIGKYANTLKDHFAHGFEYSDCKVDDSRLVILNAMDARAHGAHILPGTRYLSAERQNNHWLVKLQKKNTHNIFELKAKAIVNAGGAWINNITQSSTTPFNVQLVKGSHIVVPALYTRDHAFIFQHSDQRIIFAIPYEQSFTLVGTTDVNYQGNPDEVHIDEDEQDYLCQAINEYFVKTIRRQDIIHSFSGIRTLVEDKTASPHELSRDYQLHLDHVPDSAPILTVVGGKITTSRVLAEDVLKTLSPYFPAMGPAWTRYSKLPGGDFEPERFEQQVEQIHLSYPFLNKTYLQQLVRRYGTVSRTVLGNIKYLDELGPCFGASLYGREVEYLMEKEWATTTEDILWRRTKTGLALNRQQVDELRNWMEKKQCRNH